MAPDGAHRQILAIPDTSALLDEPDLARYRAFLAVTMLDIYLVAPVLAELDLLKDQGRTPEVRQKARDAGRAIKAIREKGSLVEGVEIEPGIRVIARPQEPRVDGAISGLDPTVPDDRLLAAAFELQSHHPSAAVVLVTSDINLQTKAEVARLPFVDPRP